MGVSNYSIPANQLYGNVVPAPNVITMSPTTEMLLIAAVCFGIFSIVMSFISRRNKRRQVTNYKKEQERLKEEERLKKSEENKRKFEERSG